MLEDIRDEIASFIEDSNRDLKFRVGDKLHPFISDCTPSIFYDYLLMNANNKYSFLNPAFNDKTSESFPNLSDSQIYFQQIQKICNTSFAQLETNIYNFKIISPNKNLKNVANFIFDKTLTAKQTPSFIEIILYTNRIGNKAPRIFGFIGNASIIYILFYDPFHEIYSATGKI